MLRKVPKACFQWLDRAQALSTDEQASTCGYNAMLAAPLLQVRLDHLESNWGIVLS